MENNERHWERFKIGYRNTTRSYLRASIDKRGVILLNAFTMERLKHPEAVALYYDRATSSIGFRPETMQDADTFPVVMRTTRGYGRIAAISFLRYHGIKVRETIVSDHLEIDSTEMLVLDLRQASERRRKHESSRK
jgi:hypothetical protein